MLPVRLAVLAALAGVSLWGLFSLLENLRKPELLRSRDVAVVKGCDPIESDEARQLCPALFCEKALLDRKIAAPDARVVVTQNRSNGSESLIGGTVESRSGNFTFACVLQGPRVRGIDQVDEQTLETLSAQDGDWSLD